MFTMYLTRESTKEALDGEGSTLSDLRCWDSRSLLRYYYPNVAYEEKYLSDPEVKKEFNEIFNGYTKLPQVFWFDIHVGSSEMFLAFLKTHYNQETQTFNPPQVRALNQQYWDGLALKWFRR